MLEEFIRFAFTPFVLLQRFGFLAPAISGFSIMIYPRRLYMLLQA